MNINLWRKEKKRNSYKIIIIRVFYILHLVYKNKLIKNICIYFINNYIIIFRCLNEYKKVLMQFVQKLLKTFFDLMLYVMFTNGPGDRSSILGRVKPKT